MLHSGQTNSPRPWRLSSLAIVVVLALAAAACGSSSKAASSASPTTPAASKPTAGGSLVVGIPTESPGWNPSINTWDDTGNLEGSTILEPLATPGADSGARPWLATDWIANTDFTRWVIHLRKGVKFQDGTPFDAQAVVDNFHTYLASPFFTLTFAGLFSNETALDDSTVQVQLSQPWAAFPSAFLSTAATYMMAPSMIAAGAASSSHPVGTGPFVFSDWKPNDSLKVTRNASYWGGLDTAGHVRTGMPYLDSIEFRVITDDGTRSDALQSGDIDMMTTISAATANSLASKFQEIKDWDGGSVFVQLNTTPTVDGKANPLANIHARTAIAYATDPKAVASIAGKGLILATSPFGASTPWGMPSDQNGYLNYNVAKAKAEVTEYKKETGASSLDFTLMGLPNIDVARTLQQLSGMWSKAGITAHIQTLDQSARITATVTGNYQATFTNNYGFPDPDNDFYFWSSSSNKTPPTISINFSHYSTDKIDADLAAGRQSGYPNVRKQAYNDLAKQLNAGLTHIWLYYTPFTYIAEKRVQGFNTLQGPAHIPFGNFAPKTWWSQIWLSS